MRQQARMKTQVRRAYVSSVPRSFIPLFSWVSVRIPCCFLCVHACMDSCVDVCALGSARKSLEQCLSSSPQKMKLCIATCTNPYY